MAHESAYLRQQVDFVCRKCSHFTSRTYADGEVTLNGDVIENAAKFSFLRDVLSFVGRVQEAVTARIRGGLKTFKAIASVLCN